MPDHAVSIESVLESYANAAAAKDVAAFMQLYDPQVRIFDAWESWTYAGAEAWEAAVRGWFDALGTEDVRVSFAETQSTVQSDMAILSTIVTYTGFSASGDELHSLQNRLTWAIRLTSSGARIIHEHSSAPIRFSDMKAILKR